MRRPLEVHLEAINDQTIKSIEPEPCHFREAGHPKTHRPKVTGLDLGWLASSRSSASRRKLVVRVQIPTYGAGDHWPFNFVRQVVPALLHRGGR
jgi:hypothetical protein